MSQTCNSDNSSICNSIRGSYKPVSIVSFVTVDTEHFALKINALEQKDNGQTAQGFNNTVGNITLFNITAEDISVSVYNKRF